MLMMSLMQMLPGCLCCAAAQDEPVPVILDTDLGDDIDDTWALAMLLGCPEISLKLIVTASDDTPAKTRLVAKILERVGRADIPIGTGAKTSDHPLNQAAWLGDYQLKDYGGEVHEDGIQAMIDFIAASKDPVTLLVIGPQTNLKAALERDPAIAEKARVVTMAGSVDIGYDGKPGRAAEYNVVKDVAAAKVVFAAPWEITMAPLDCCGTLRLSGGALRTSRVVGESARQGRYGELRPMGEPQSSSGKRQQRLVRYGGGLPHVQRRPFEDEMCRPHCG